MSDDLPFSHSGRGSGHFLLGNGPGATGGNVVIELRCMPSPDASVSIEWLAPPAAMPAEARQVIVSYLEAYLRGYLNVNPVGSLRVQVVDAGWFTDRRNEPERAAVIALHDAIRDAKLPPPVLYAEPSD